MNEGSYKQPLQNRIVIAIAVIMLYGILFAYLYQLPFVANSAINLSILPIVAWSLFLGWFGGLLIGILLPFINIALLFSLGETSFYIDHDLSYWIIHLFYAFVGLLLGIVLYVRQYKIDKAFKKIDTDKRLHYLANHDPLTRLPNRTLLFDRMKHAVAVAKRRKKLLGVLFIDLDNFKEVNDSCGHATGDKLLVIVGDRLGKCLRESDTVARIGGDEFVILLEGVTERKAISQISEKILDCIVKPILIGDVTFNLSASIGISIYPWDNSDDIDVLLNHADEAMYNAKSKGYGTISFYGEKKMENGKNLYPFNQK